MSGASRVNHSWLLVLAFPSVIADLGSVLGPFRSRVPARSCVRQGPEGFIYIAIDGRRGAATAVYRLEPAGGR